ncbi:hypothetical protein SDC9_174733 [bioreactor metagenome]|uniref:Uncharacterized protein n=1 Tax=bioreactor metagenome TaxID=1076179 RepID=A0A645GN34_9ZZZZ
MAHALQPAVEQAFEDHANQCRGDDGEEQRGEEAAQPLVESGRQEGADHVQRAMGKVDEIHDAEYQRQAGGQQEEHQAVLQAIEGLLENQIEHVGSA